MGRDPTLLRAAVLAGVLALAAAGAARAQESWPVELNPGDLGARIYVPEGLGAGRPLVVALHGCYQTGADYDDETGWTGLAEELGFVLLLPEQWPGNNSSRCFNWMLPEDRERGRGEPESIKQMIDAVVQRHGIDTARIFVTGLSAGGAMTAVLLATYPELFAGGAVIAGLPYLCVTLVTPPLALTGAAACMQGGNPLVADARGWGDRVRAATELPAGSFAWPRVSIWHGAEDRVVNPINGEDLMAQWTDVHGIDQAPEADQAVGPHRRRVYRDGAEAAPVELWTIADMGHAVPVDPDNGCGRDRVQASDFSVASNDYMADAGICASRRIADFWGLAE